MFPHGIYGNYGCAKARVTESFDSVVSDPVETREKMIQYSVAGLTAATSLFENRGHTALQALLFPPAPC